MVQLGNVRGICLDDGQHVMRCCYVIVICLLTASCTRGFHQVGVCERYEWNECTKAACQCYREGTSHCITSS